MLDVLFSSRVFKENGFELTDHFDFSDIGGLNPTYSTQLLALTNSSDPFYGNVDVAPTISAVDGEIVYGDKSTDAIVITASNLADYADLNALITALQDASPATGAISQIDVIYGGGTILTASVTETGYTLSSGTESLSLTGATPASFQDLYDFFGKAAEILAGGALTDATNEAYATFFDDYGLSGLTFSTGATDLFSFTESTTQISISAGGGALVFDGTFPGGNIGTYIRTYGEVINELTGANGHVGLGDLTNLGVTQVTLTDMNGIVLFQLSGDMTNYEFDTSGNTYFNDSTDAGADITIEGLDSADEDDWDEIEGSFMDWGANSVEINMNDGDDAVNVLATSIARNAVDPLAPMTVDGGDGYDKLHIHDEWSDNISVDFLAGSVSAWEDANGENDPSYLFAFDNFERADVTASFGELLVQGDAGNNRVRVIEFGGYMEFLGGDGFDRLELHRTNNTDGSTGLTLDMLQLLYNIEVDDNGNISVYDAVYNPGSLAGYFESVESLRLLKSRDSTETQDYTADQILDDHEITLKLSSSLFDGDFPSWTDYFDFTALSNVTPVHLPALAGLEDPTHPFFAMLQGGPVALTSDTLVYSNDGDAALPFTAEALVITGLGLDQLSDLPALEANLLNGTAIGEFTGFQIHLGGANVLNMSVEDDGLLFTSGTLSLELIGAAPTGFQEIFDMVTMIQTIMGMSNPTLEDIDTISEFFSSYSLSQILLTDGIGDDTVTLFSLSESTTQILLEVGGASLEFNGTFPAGNFGGYFGIIGDILASVEAEQPVTFDRLTQLGITNIYMEDSNGNPLFELLGDLNRVMLGEGMEIVNDEDIEFIVEIVGDATDNEIFDPVIWDDQADGVLVRMDGGDDYFEVDGSTRDNHPNDVAPITVDGGDGYDVLAVMENDQSSKHVEVDFTSGTVSATNVFDNPSYEVEFRNIERVDLDLGALSLDGATVTGDDGRNRLKLVNLQGLIAGAGQFEFDGGGDRDRLELHRIDNGDGTRGMTLAELNAAFDFDVQPDNTIHLLIKGTTDVAMILSNVEEIRLLVEDAGEPDRDLWGNENYSLTEIAGITDFVGTPGNDTIEGNALDNDIQGLAGDDSLWAKQGGDNTIDAGEGGDWVEVAEGNHDLDGGADDDWDSLGFEDDTSEFVVANALAGTISGQSNADGSGTVYYTSSWTNFSSFESSVDGILVFNALGSSEGRVLGLSTLPQRFEFVGDADEWNTLGLKWTRFPGESDRGYTQVEFEALFDIEADPTDNTHIIIKHKGTNDVFGELWNVDEVQFWNADRDDSSWLKVSELAGITDFTGTEGDDDIRANGLDNTITGLGGDDRLRGEGGNDTVDAGAGYDYIGLKPGNHNVDGGDDFDTVDIYDFTSEAYVFDLAAGEIRGQSSLAPDATVYYTTQIANVEGGSSFVSGDVQVVGTGDWLYFGIGTVPTSLNINNGSGEGRMSLRWTNNPDGSQGVQRADFLSQFEIVQLDPSGKNFDIKVIATGYVIAELRGMTMFEFYDPTASDGRDRGMLFEIASPAPIAGVGSDPTVFTGTEDFDRIIGTDGDDSVIGNGGDDLILGLEGNDTFEGGLGDDVFGADGRTADTVHISDAGGTDTLVTYNYPGLDSFTFAWDGTSATRTTTYGHQTIIDGLNGSPVIEQIRWVDIDENGDIRSTRPDLQLIVDQADFTRFDVVFAGTDGNDTITAPNLDAESTDARWGEIFGNGGDDEINLVEQFTHFAYGGDGNDTIRVQTDAIAPASDVEPAGQLIQGGAGDDLVQTVGGDDTLHGDTGNDTLEGGDGDDTYSADGSTADTTIIRDTDGVDTLMMFDHEGIDAYLFEWDETTGTLTRTTAKGHTTIMESDDGGQSIEQAFWDGDGWTSRTMDIVTDAADLATQDKYEFLFAGTDGDDTVTVRTDLTGEDSRGAWGEIYTNDGDDVVTLTSQFRHYTYTAEGDDTVTVAQGDDTVNVADHQVLSGDGADSVMLSDGDDTILGGDGDDTLGAGAGENEVFGEGGDDVLIMGMGATETLDGGDGFDEVLIDVSSHDPAAYVAETNLATGDSGAVGNPNFRDTLVDIEAVTVTGGISFDLEGNDADNRLTTDEGDDTVDGGAGDDTITTGAGSDSATGGDGNDTFIHTPGSADSDTIDGGTGVDRFVVDLSAAPDGLVVEMDLTSGSDNVGELGEPVGRETVINVEEFRVTGPVDITATGSAADEAFWFDGGDHTVDGGDGLDKLLINDDSAALLIDLTAGTMSGQSDLTDTPSEVHYTTSFVNIEGLGWVADGDVKIIGNQTTGLDSDVFALVALPGSLTIDNGAGTGVLDLAHFLVDGEPVGLTLDQFKALVSIRPIGESTSNFTLLLRDGGTELGTLTGVTHASFLDPDNPGTPLVLTMDEVATGVTIDGTAEEDETLTANIDDLDGDAGSHTYQWHRDGDDITDATDATYTLTQDDVGKKISVTVDFTVDGVDDSATSPATGDVANVNDEPTGTLEITGTAMQGETLTAVLTGLDDEDGITGDPDYQWMRDGSPIDGATDTTYLLTADDIWHPISVEISFTDDQGTDESMLSEPTSDVVIDADATICEIDTGEHYDEYLANQSVTDKDVDGNPTFLTEFVSDYVDHPGGNVAAPTGYTLIADADPLEQSGTQEFNIRAFVNAVSNSSYGIILQDFEEDGAGDEDYASGNFAGAGHSYTASTYGGTTHDSASGSMADGTADGKLIVTDVMSVSLFDTGNAAAANPDNGDDPGIATNLGNDADRGYNKTPVSDPDLGQYLEALPGEDDNGGVLICFDQGTTVYGFGLNLLGRQDDKRPVYLDIHFSDGSVYRTLTDSDGHQEGGEQYFSYLVDPDESDVSIAAVVFYEPYDASTDNAGDRDIFGIDDLALAVAPADADLTSDEYVSTLGINTASGGTLAFTGDVEEDATLTADISGLTDVDGVPTDLSDFSFQWFRGDTPIGGETGSEYTLTQDDVGETIKLSASWVDDYGNAEEAESAASDPVANVNDNPTGIVTITGDAEEGSKLTADASGVDDEDGMGAISYQWKRDGTDISDATGQEFTLRQADVGKTITVVASYTDGEGTDEEVESSATAAVTNVNDDPIGLITIVGTPEEDAELRVNTTRLIDEDGITGDLTIEWLRGGREGRPIAGADSSTYTLTANDIGQKIAVRISYTDDGGAEESILSIETAEVGNINDDPTGGVVITGTQSEGNQLTADTTSLEDEDGLGDLNYQWQRDGEDIDGADGETYDLVQDDVGSVIAVTVSYTDDGGADESVTSDPTYTIANQDDPTTGEVLIEGTPTEGAVLSADTSGLEDPDGMGTFTYQWKADGVDIDGATGVEFLLTQDQVDAEITVVVTHTDALGGETPITSDATAPVTNTNTSPTGNVVVTGLAIEGAFLAADVSGLGDDDGMTGVSFTYQWLRDGQPIGAATSDTYQITADDANASLSVRVRYTDDGGTAETVTSAGTSQVAVFNITGTDGDDDLDGNLLNNTIDGMAGDDTMTGKGGDDTLDGGTGNDDMDGGAGDDEYDVDGRTSDTVNINDASGTDTLVIHDYAGIDAKDFVWNGSTLTRTTTYGHSTVIGALAGVPVIEQVRWVDEEGAGYGTNTLQIITDQANFNRYDAVFAGSDNDDTITAPDLDATSTSAPWGEIFGNGGDDEILLADQFTMIAYGGDGADTITIAPDVVAPAAPAPVANQFVLGQGGRDSVETGDGDDIILGGEGSDTLTGGAGNDSVDGGDGDDWIIHTRGGEDTYIGGAGIDFIALNFTSESGFEYEIDLASGDMGVVGSTSNRDVLDGIEAVDIRGSINVDVTGSDSSNSIKLGDGDDTADGGAGGDAIEGGGGADDLSGGTGNDFITGDVGADTIDGGDGTDYAFFDGAFGTDFTLAEGAGGTVEVTRVAGGEVDTLTNVEYFSFNNDILSLSMIENGFDNTDNAVDKSGESGDLELEAGGGDDTVGGGSGSDTIDSGTGDDSVGGGAGDDNIFDALGDDTISGGEGKDTGRALSGNNSFVEADEETAEDDYTIDDFYSGGYGDDNFETGGGNDILIGDRGSIYFFGDDTLKGGTGDDILEGSGGADVFIFRSGDGDDLIGKVDLASVEGATYVSEVLFEAADFQLGIDKVKLEGFAVTSTADLDAALGTTFTITDDGIGNAKFTTPDGSITFVGIDVADLSSDDFIF